MVRKSSWTLATPTDPKQEKELSVGFTIVNAQGVSDCKYVVGYYFKPGPTRPKFAEMWPKTPEENLERLAKDTGVPMEHKLPLAAGAMVY